MDIDAAARQLPDHAGREYLHVAGQHDQADALLAHEAQHLRLLLRPVVLRYRQVHEGDAVPFHQPAGVVVVGDDQRDVCSEPAGLAPVQAAQRRPAVLLPSGP